MTTGSMLLRSSRYCYASTIIIYFWCQLLNGLLQDSVTDLWLGKVVVWDCWVVLSVSKSGGLHVPICGGDCLTYTYNAR